jgi:hypothetical protein
MVPIPWSEVRAPKIIPLKRPPIEIGAMARLDDLGWREHEIKVQNRRRLGIGCAIIASITGIVVPLIFRWMEYAQSIKMNVRDDLTLREVLLIVGAINAILLAVTFPLAVFTAPKSRSQRINEFIDSGSRTYGPTDSSLTRIIFTFLMLGLLLGEFLVIDGIRSHWLRIRLRHVDRHRAALILQMLMDQPCGIDPRSLIRIGENPRQFRQILAYLMTYEWANISSKGNCLTLLSPAKRQLKHAEEGFFAATADV